MQDKRGTTALMLMLVMAFVAFTSAQSIIAGDRIFYAETLYVNRNFGAGAAFKVNMWCKNTPSTVAVDNQQFLRLDYIDNSGSRYMTEVFDYVKNEKSQICLQGTNRVCKRTRYVRDQPQFFAASETHNVVPEPVRTYLAYGSCGTGAVAYEIKQNGPLLARYVIYRSDGTLCRIILSKLGSLDQFEGEYLIQNYTRVGEANPKILGERPKDKETYTAVTAGANCPEPKCIANLELALVIDESGSMADNRETVRAFTLSLINRLSVGPENIRLGLVYFSGGDCNLEWNGNSFDSCTGGCATCGGVYNVTFQGLSGDVSFVRNIVQNHNPAGGFTCLECGIKEGADSLNFNPRAGVPKAMILVTDAFQNRHFDLLAATAAQNMQSNITTYAVAIGEDPSEEELLLITGSRNRIFNVTDFNALVGAINTIVLPLCQTLPDIDSCSSCPGLCKCGESCQCPNSCDDSNICTTPVCDATGTGGLCIQNQVSCDDNNACTVDTCDPVLGCRNNQTRPSNIPADNLCTVYKCNPATGIYSPENVGDQNCGPIPGDLCNVRYCNSATGKCAVVNKGNIKAGESVTVTDSDGSNRTISGCGKPDGALDCIVYGCNGNTGQCTIDNRCECTTDAGCNDQDGCTIDRCIAGSCVRTRIDCLSELSNGVCSLSQAITATERANTLEKSRLFVVNNNTAQYLVNGTSTNPAIANRSCGDLACFLGQPSRYQCVSNSDSAHTCARFTTNTCTSNGCTNSLCAPRAQAFSNGQLPTECVNQDFTCTAPGDICSSASCNSSAPAFPESGRCFTRQTTFCNDGDDCTNDACVTNVGCVYTPITPPVGRQNTTCLSYQCIRGSFFPILPGNCQSNPNDRCIIDFCESDTCSFVNRTSLLGERTVTSATNNTITVQGCAKPQSGVPECLVYGCDSVTGACTIDSSGCECNSTNAATACNNGDACSVGTCNLNTLQCEYQPFDCLSQLSNGNCLRTSSGFNITLSREISLDFLYGRSTINFDENGNRPTVADRSCEALAVFKGQPSTYQCVSENSLPVCVRNPTACVSTGCQDRLAVLASDTFNGAGQFNAVCVDGDAPDCSDTFCDRRTCNPLSVAVLPLSNRCTSVPNNRCNDGDACTLDICNDDSPVVPGSCDNSLIPVPTPQPTCFNQVCVNGEFIKVPKPNECSEQANQCLVEYCDPVNDRCSFVNRSAIVRGDEQTVTNQFGETITVSGCAAPPGALDCVQYGCDSLTGLCIINTTQCVCRVDADCEDANGCTTGRCVDGGRRCEIQQVDCYAELSNGLCVIDQEYTASQIVGRLFASGNAQVINDEIGNPQGIFELPKTGVNRTCNDLACFNGQRNRYYCRSDSPTTHTCLRSPVNCFGRRGCGTEFCETLGGWFNGQIRTNCFQEDVFCNDNNPCTIDQCNAAYDPSQFNTQERCIFTPINAAVVCNDGNDCTVDQCNPCITDGTIQPFCEHIPLSGAALEARCPSQPCKVTKCVASRCAYSDVVCPNPIGCAGFVCDPSNSSCVVVVAPGFDVDTCIREINIQDNTTVTVPPVVPTGGKFAVCSYNDKACVQNPFCVQGNYGVCNPPFVSANNNKYYVVDLVNENTNRVRFYTDSNCQGSFVTELPNVQLGQCGVIDDISFRFTASSAAVFTTSLLVVLALFATLLF